MDNNERYINPYTDFGFTKLFEQAEIARYDPTERRQYEESRKEYWDYTSTLQTAEKKGHAEGLAEGRAEGLAEGIEKGRKDEKITMAQKLKSMGVLSVEQIADTTGLSVEEIERLGA